MATVYDVKASDVVSLAAERLKDKLKKPAYMSFVKSGAGKERMPLSQDFWYVRSASILRQVYMNGPVGVSRLRTKYGNKKEHVVHRKHHVRAGGSIIRDAMLGLEKAGYLKNTKAGRVITPQGKSFIDKICKELYGKQHAT
jgi:small subunit ribosomal protein S19e